MRTIGLCLIALCVSGVTVDDSNHISREWSDYAQLADRFDTAPTWHSRATPSDEEWSAAVRLAIDLTALSDDEICAVLLVYMCRYSTATPNQLQLASSRPQIVLRLLFDIPPEAAYPKLEEQQPVDASSLAIFPVPNEVRSNRVGIPVCIANGLPAICESPHRIDAFGLGASKAYQPHKDFAFLKQRFPMRRDLADMLSRLSKRSETHAR